MFEHRAVDRAPRRLGQVDDDVRTALEREDNAGRTIGLAEDDTARLPLHRSRQRVGRPPRHVRAPRPRRPRLTHALRVERPLLTACGGSLIMRRVRAGGGGGLWDAPGGRQTRTNARPHAIKFGRDREVAILSSSGPREQNGDSRRGRAPKRLRGCAAETGRCGAWLRRAATV